MFTEVAPDSPEAREAMSRYYAELDERFEDGFDPGPPAPEDAEMRFVVFLGEDTSDTGHHRVLAGGGVREYGGAAEVKRMWVSPDARGQRLGTRLLAYLEDVAREMGFETVRLDTRGAALPEAVALYEKAGYVRIERYNDNPHATHFFAKSLV